MLLIKWALLPIYTPPPTLSGPDSGYVHDYALRQKHVEKQRHCLALDDNLDRRFLSPPSETSAEVILEFS